MFGILYVLYDSIKLPYFTHNSILNYRVACTVLYVVRKFTEVFLFILLIS